MLCAEKARSMTVKGQFDDKPESQTVMIAQRTKPTIAGCVNPILFVVRMSVLSVNPPIVQRGDRGGLAALKGLIDPLSTLAMLAAACVFYGEPIRAAEVILGLITFSITYPGDIPFRHQKRGLIREVAGNWALTAGLLLLFGFGTGTITMFNPNVLYLWALLVPAAQVGIHSISPRLLLRYAAIKGYRSAIVVGATELGWRIAEKIAADPYDPVRVVGVYDDIDDVDPDSVSTGKRALAGTLSDIAKYTRANQVDTIYIALPLNEQPSMLKLLDDLRDTTASIYYVPDFFMFDLIQARVESVAGVPVVAVCESPFHGTTALIKRVSDLVIACLAIIVLSPVFIATAIAVKASSPGPILFRQRRYGLDGKEIVVWKFRSMRVMEDGERVVQATQDDPRVTKVGAFIRRTSIDELPQFFNVLQGHMSVVGPRPHAVAHNEAYRTVIKGYMVRHKVKPGITGWAQVNGARGETRTLQEMEDRIRYDLDYLRNWSLRLDMKIVLKTVLVFAGDKKAY